MKSEFTTWKLPVLIGVLVVVALLINVFFFKRAADRRKANAQAQQEIVAAAAAKAAQEKQQQAAKAAAKTAEAARKKAAEEAAAARARFLARYLNSGFERKPGIATIGVAIASETGTMNPTVATALTQRLKTAEVELLNSFFKPEFVADRFVSDILAGDTAIFQRLELTNALHAVLVGKQTASYSTNAALENTITANVNLEVALLPVGLTRASQSWNFSANGIGFRPQEARQLAEQRIIDQIARDTNLVLAPRF